MSDAPPGDGESREAAAGPDGHDAGPAGGDPRDSQDGPYAWYKRGLDLLGRGSAAAAAQLLARAADAEPGSRSAREALARAQFDAGHYRESAESFRAIVDASPSDDYAHFGLGLALARTGDPAAAAEYLALAAAMRPDLPHYTEALRGVRATLRARADADIDGDRPAAGGQDGGPAGGQDGGPAGGQDDGPAVP